MTGSWQAAKRRRLAVAILSSRAKLKLIEVRSPGIALEEDSAPVVLVPSQAREGRTKTPNPAAADQGRRQPVSRSGSGVSLMHNSTAAGEETDMNIY